jgi:hypothetical protein
LVARKCGIQYRAGSATVSEDSRPESATGVLTAIEEGEFELVHIGLGSGGEVLAEGCSEGEDAVVELDQSTVLKMFE